MYRALFRPAQALNLIQRFGQSRRFQYRTYTRSTRQKSEKLTEFGQSPSSSRSSWKSWAIPTAAVGAVVGVASFIRYNDERRSIAKGEDSRESNTVKGPTIGGPFTLINSKYQTVTEQDLLGNWVLLYFGYTSSPDIGPEEVQKLAKTVDLLGSKHHVKLLPIFVTIDPQRDSPSQLNAYLKEFDSRIVGLTGPVNSIRQIAQEYRVFFKKVEEDGNDYLIDSSHHIYLMNPKMEMARCFGTEYSAVELAEAVAKEMKNRLHVD